MKIFEGTYDQLESIVRNTRDQICLIQIYPECDDFKSIRILKNGKFHNPYGISYYSGSGYRDYELDGKEILTVERSPKSGIEVNALLKKLRKSKDYTKL